MTIRNFSKRRLDFKCWFCGDKAGIGNTLFSHILRGERVLVCWRCFEDDSTNGYWSALWDLEKEFANLGKNMIKLK